MHVRENRACLPQNARHATATTTWHPAAMTHQSCIMYVNALTHERCGSLLSSSGGGRSVLIYGSWQIRKKVSGNCNKRMCIHAPHGAESVPGIWVQSRQWTDSVRAWDSFQLWTPDQCDPETRPF